MHPKKIIFGYFTSKIRHTFFITEALSVIIADILFAVTLIITHSKSSAIALLSWRISPVGCAEKNTGFGVVNIKLVQCS